MITPIRYKVSCRAIADAERDPTISGIALNLSGMYASPVMQWEDPGKTPRRFQRDRQARAEVYIDRCGITTYHLASVADYIVMDPQGVVQLTGFAYGRGYVKGMLEKLGIGVEEIRSPTYKSAARRRLPGRRDERRPTVNSTSGWPMSLMELVQADIMAARRIPEHLRTTRE